MVNFQRSFINYLKNNLINIKELHLTAPLVDAYVASAAVWNAKQSALPNFASGQILFGQGNSIPLTASELYWDNVNKRLGIGIIPVSTIEGKGKAGNSGSGTIITDGWVTVTGTGTHFLTELAVGDVLTVGSSSRTVYRIDSDTSCRVSQSWNVSSPSAYTITKPIFTMRDSDGNAVLNINKLTTFFGAMSTGSSYAADGAVAFVGYIAGNVVLAGDLYLQYSNSRIGNGIYNAYMPYLAGTANAALFSQKSFYFNIDSDNNDADTQAFYWGKNSTGASATNLMTLFETGLLLIKALKFSTLPPIYANNAAAVAGGLAAGDIYRTNADPDPLCIVH